MIRLLPTLTLTILLTSCATIPTTNTSPLSHTPWKERQVLLNRLQSWKLSGKIAVITAQDSGSATVEWAQQGQRYDISFLGPLGANGLKLYGQPGQVTLITADGKRTFAKSAEQLLAKQWGWKLPVSNLNYWIRGLPVPGVPYNGQYDAANRLSSFSQQGWNVQYLSYMAVGSLELPNRISIASPSFKTKLAIYDWKLP